MATLTIPAAYLEDARSAAMIEVREGAERLQGEDPEDRPSSATDLSRDARLLEALLAADGDTMVEAENDEISDPIQALLEGIIQHVIGRLHDECIYSPLPTRDMVNLVKELEWAIAKACALWPEYWTEQSLQAQVA